MSVLFPLLLVVFNAVMYVIHRELTYVIGMWACAILMQIAIADRRAERRQ